MTAPEANVFCELLARSAFSFLEGASMPAELVRTARALDMPAMAICDRDGMYGLPRALVDDGARLVVGAELTLEREDGTPHGSVALLVKDADGYTTLCRLLTLAHATHEKGTAGIDVRRLAEEVHGGLVAIAPLERALSEDGDDVFSVLRDAFGDDAFVAAFRHHGAADVLRTRAADAVEARFGLRVVASARPLHHVASRRALADVLACIRHKTTLDEAGTLLADNAERYVRGDREMRALFADRLAWVERTGLVAARCTFGLREIRYRFPSEISSEPGETADATLRRVVEEGVARRYADGAPPAVRTQLEKELALIAKLEVAPYFLSVRQIVEMARAREILCQGRGSAANSAVCYMLGITSVDPARSSLLFERFLSAERTEPPDIDVDFEHTRREEVIQEIYRTWGRDRAAMVSEIICYRGKSALRETAKVFGLGKDQVDRLAGLVLHMDTEGQSAARLREVGLDPEDARLKQVLVLARELEGIPRHLSIHVGGFVLSAAPLEHVAPVEPARMADRTVVPWDKDDLDTLGFFKVDVLGLGMLTALRKCFALVHARSGSTAKFDPIEALAAVPRDDPSVYAAIQRADTVGVFQIESRAQMSMLPRLKPSSFYDLVIEVAIVRPGPIQGGMVHPYLRRRMGKEKTDPPHPCLAPILDRTLGVPLFQEQVMQIAMVGAGYTPGEADQLRRDMAAWRRNGQLARHRGKLLEGFRLRGIPDTFAEQLYKQIHGFAEYGFPESHAASFAILVYASSWLKVHHPAAFACALLSSQPMGFYSASSIVQDAQRHGVIVRPPCVVASTWSARLEMRPEQEPALRLGLQEIRGLPESTANAIVDARAVRPFASLEDLGKRAGVAERELAVLAEAGALEALEPERRRAMWRAHAQRAPGLFDGATMEDADAVSLAPMAPFEQLVLDYERVGLSVDDHPLRYARARLKRRGVVTSADLSRLAHGTRVKVGGLVIGRQRPETASGVTFVTLEDETGVVNLVVWRDVFEAHWRLSRHARSVIVTGHVQREGIVIHVLAETFEELPLDQPLDVRSRDFH